MHFLRGHFHGKNERANLGERREGFWGKVVERTMDTEQKTNKPLELSGGLVLKNLLLFTTQHDSSLEPLWFFVCRIGFGRDFLPKV